MVNNIEELKNLIIWAKEQKVKTLKLADIHVELSDLAFLEALQPIVNSESKQPDVVDSKKDEDDVLFWSSNP